jgi:TPR repeat protein
LAQLNLGVRYERGAGVPRDYVEAYMWFSLAAAQGETDARKKLDLIEALLTPEQRGEAQKCVDATATKQIHHLDAGKVCRCSQLHRSVLHRR